MWSFLHKRYAASTTVNRSSVHSTLVRQLYRHQALHKLISKLDSCSALLVSKNATVYEGLIKINFTKSFGEQIKSPYGPVVSPLLVNGYITWHQISSRMWQDHASHEASMASPEQSLTCHCGRFEEKKKTVSAGIVSIPVILKPPDKSRSRTRKATMIKERQHWQSDDFSAGKKTAEGRIVRWFK